MAILKELIFGFFAYNTEWRNGWWQAGYWLCVAGSIACACALLVVMAVNAPTSTFWWGVFAATAGASLALVYYIAKEATNDHNR